MRERAKGRRWYDWAWIEMGEHEGAGPAGRSATALTWPFADAGQTGRSAFLRWRGWPDPAGAPRSAFQATKSEVGFDHYPVRKRIAWYRHLAMVARAHLAFPAATRPFPPAMTAPARLTTSPQGTRQNRTVGGGAVVGLAARLLRSFVLDA